MPDRIQEHLLHALHANPSNWPTTIQAHALSLLRSGEVSSFPALLRRVIEDVRQDTALAPNANGSANKAVNGNSEENGAGGGGAVNGKKAESTNGTSNGARQSLAVPQSVVDDALKITRECLDAVCEMDESGA